MFEAARASLRLAMIISFDETNNQISSADFLSALDNNDYDERVQSLLEQIFSYEDYMRFLELFLEQITANKDATTGYSSNHEEETSARSLYSFQNVSYNPAIVNLLTQTPNV